MKRMTDTEKWNDRWFRRLDTKWKCVWLYCKDTASNHGIINLDTELAGFRINSLIQWDEFEKVFEGRIFPIMSPIKQKRYWMPELIYEQCGKLSDTCAAHKAVIRELEAWGLTEKYDDWMCEMTAEMKGKEENFLPGFPGATGERPPIEELQTIVNRWNALVKGKGLRGISAIGGERLKNYQKRLAENPVFWKILEREIPLLKKFARGDNESSWRITFDYCVESQDKFQKLREGGWRDVKEEQRLKRVAAQARKDHKQMLKDVDEYVEMIQDMGDSYTEADMTASKRAFAHQYGIEALELVEAKLKEPKKEE